MDQSPCAESLPGLFSIRLADESVLPRYYLDYVQNGGLFVPTDKPAALGESVFLIIHLSQECFATRGRVIWITPENAGLDRPTGIGVEFLDLPVDRRDPVKAVIDKLPAFSDVTPRVTF